MPIEQFEEFYCPYCGEPNQLSVDMMGGYHQEFVTDCEVCCAPIIVNIQISGDEIVSLETRQENE